MFSDSNNKKYDTIIDASNQHIYPGIIALNSNLGLVEVDAVRASVDDDEAGTYLPEVRSIIAYNAESKAVESMRPNGVLVAQIAPNGGVISGSSSVVQLDAWNWEDAVIKYDQGLHINWPSPYTFGRWWLGEERGLKANNNYNKQVNDQSSTEISNSSVFVGALEDAIQSADWEAVYEIMPKIYFVSDRSRSIVDTIADLGFQDIEENGLMIFHLLRAFNFKQKKSHVWTYASCLINKLKGRQLPKPSPKGKLKPDDILELSLIHI